jgi:hypothetical protein
MFDVGEAFCFFRGGEIVAPPYNRTVPQEIILSEAIPT